MKTPVALVFALGMFWSGLIRGGESPGTTMTDFLVMAAVLIAVAIAWEVGARMVRARRASGPARS